MMIWEVTPDNRWLKLTEYDDEMDLRQVDASFTRKVANWHFLKKQKKFSGWDGEVKFLQKKRYLPVGLWRELLAINEKYSIGMEVFGLERIVDTGLTLDAFRQWVDRAFAGGIGGDPNKLPRDYQVEAAYKIIKFRISSQELATNAGKTFITFMVLAYLFEHGLATRFLMVVPTTNLVIQGVEDFEEYGAHKYGMKFQQIHSESKKVNPDANVVMGTYQSLVKKDGEWLSKFDVVFVDEAHSTPAQSVKQIIAQCVGSVYRFGLSGTLTAVGEETADYFTIQMCLGPMVGKITPDFLIENKFATPVEIRVIRMSYLPDETKQRLHRLRKNKQELSGADIYNIEKKLVTGSNLRLRFVTEMIVRATNNTLVLFQSVEDGYGKSIYDRLREITSDREVFYIDGDTKNDLRDDYKQRMKVGTGKVLVASFGTFSTGISINNIHNIFFVESYKSENIVKQSIGRGLRIHESKNKVHIIDFVDDFSWKGSSNYLLDHMQERKRIYEKENFPYNEYEIDLTQLFS